MKRPLRLRPRGRSSAINLLLLEDADFLPDGTARLTGRRLRHAREVLGARAGDVLRVGRLNGPCGTAEVLAQSDEALTLRPTLDAPPPPRPGVDLLLAIPRPKALKKLLPAVASLGVDTVVLVNAARVEKSYFDSKVLSPAAVAEHFALGLEQAKDTVPPRLLLRERFRPFVEDELDEVFGRQALRLLAHPSAGGPTPPKEEEARRLTLAIGPEGGWVPFEVELLSAHGFTPVSLGPRTLRVEVAVPYALGALWPRR